MKQIKAIVQPFMKDKVLAAFVAGRRTARIHGLGGQGSGYGNTIGEAGAWSVGNGLSTRLSTTEQHWRGLVSNWEEGLNGASCWCKESNV